MKGILFTEPLFHKVIEGIKTQTRRIVKPSPDYINKGNLYDDIHERVINPKYKVGEILYLKEPYYKDSNDIHYKYGYPENQQEMDKYGLKWKNKLFMPESAARYFIKITAVRAESLQDISEQDCLKEGIEDSDCGGMKCVCFGLREGLFFEELGSTPQDAYAALINRITGKGTWEKNPCVWVYDFEII